MNFIRYGINNEEKLGILKKGKVFSLSELGIKEYKDMISLIENVTEKDIVNIKKNMDVSKGIKGIAVEEVKILSPIKRPIHDIICVGLNYEKHYEETKEEFAPKLDLEKVKTIYFSKRASEIIGDGDNIISHDHLDEDLDYEVELAVIIGKKGKEISYEDAEDYIFGYSILNDISARTLQKGHSQWYMGKSIDTFTTMGPVIVHSSEIPFPLELNISSKINGEIRQNSNTRHMIKDVAQIISELSKGITLEPGDIIATGTPEGVGMGFNPPKYLKVGDRIECVIEGIGSLKNNVIK